MMKYIKILTALVMTPVVFNTACAAKTTIESDAVTSNKSQVESAYVTTSSQYLKPGAAVSYSYNLPKQIEPNEVVTFQLNLREAYQDGLLNVALKSEGNMQFVATSTAASFDMANAKTHVMDISFTAGGQGRHYINVHAMAEQSNGQARPRIFSIPVQVGDEVPMKPHENMEKTASGENIIAMEAEEVIR